MSTQPKEPTPPAFAPKTSPFCANLATKKSFFLDGPAMSEDELLDGSRHCWCAKTQRSLGPDRKLVDPDLCQAGRDCFESVL